MTPQEVIKTLEVAKAEVEWNYPMDYVTAIDEAIKAVEKQIPKNSQTEYSEAKNIKTNILRNKNMVEKEKLMKYINESVLTNYMGCWVYEINEVDGYKIKVE